MSPDRLLAAADDMLRGVGTVGSAAVTGGWWPKACACLIRLALETGLDAYWQRVDPAVAACGRGRTKLLMLHARRGPGPEIARRMNLAWATLSRAMHHHIYEAPLSAMELRSLHGEVAELVTRLRG
ncbi:MAG TPA: hypothetical protein VK028_10875 [Micromonosporaceae bacterium]|nr:hypothetical protein [Micromonosporaceae bacterium]